MKESRSHVEVLAPAGSMESMMAAVQAGADAIYMGGSRFGARAYADNPEEDRFLEAIDYAHLHGCRLYMTVNTLVKEQEFGQLYEFLKPYYERGLDAVIVQDMGVFSWIRRQFPDLAIHASTQMTVTGWRSAAMLKARGAARVVTARELSLDEIASIRDHVDIEIESFVHGALCYCYSGQCLLSSLIGGRSGNRGRCAQPCRLPYDVPGGARGKERYVLSLKDLCTLDILPDIIEAGVYSLKIEGRMKSPRYTAGVVSIYRKYVDLYLEKGRQGYRVDPADRQMLLDLFDRGGFTEGYYRQHNGRDMVALKEKPAFREGNQALFDRIDRDYVNHRRQEPVKGRVTVQEGEPVRLLLTLAGEKLPQISVEVTGMVASTAQNQPLSEEKLRKQMNKTGNAEFYFEELDCDLSGNCFLPLQALNELRRNGMEQLREELLGLYRRRAALPISRTETGSGERGSEPVRTKSGLSHPEPASVSKRQDWRPRIHVSLEEPEGFETVLAHKEADEICLDAAGFAAESWERAVQACHDAGKSCGLVLPHIFRREAEQYLKAHSRELTAAGFDEVILRSLEEISFLDEIGLKTGTRVFDANLYAMNRTAAGWMRQAGAGRLTLPLELNSRELEQLTGGTGELGGTDELAGTGEQGGNDELGKIGELAGIGGWELIAYGYLPVMVSAQCVQRTTRSCSKKPGILFMKDRTGKELPVKNHCRFCYNTIYNPSPLSLLGQEKTVERLRPQVLRLSFTMETPRQMKAVIDAYADHFRYGRDTKAPFDDFTRGHMKRGVE